MNSGWKISFKTLPLEVIEHLVVLETGNCLVWTTNPVKSREESHSMKNKDPVIDTGVQTLR